MQAGEGSLDVTERFRSAWQRESVSDEPTTELLPTALARSARVALAAVGAGLSVLSGEHRVPIGASDATATRAEQLQFTVGVGPCLEALANRRPVRVDEDQIREEWPAYFAELRAQTPYRSIVAVPLAITDTLRGALDLYFTSPATAVQVTDAQAASVAVQVSSVLTFASDPPSDTERWTGLEMPAWVYGPQARDRLRVWIAVGVLMAHHSKPAPDALVMLRAYAYGHRQSVEQTSDALISASAAPEDFGPFPN